MPFCATDSAGDVSLHLPHTNCGEATLTAKGGEVIPVRGVRLDSVVDDATAGRIRLAKIDIEGAEELALTGMAGLLPRLNLLVVEIHEDGIRQLGGSPDSLLDRMRAAGFTAALPAVRPAVDAWNGVPPSDTGALSAGLTSGIAWVSFRMSTEENTRREGADWGGEDGDTRRRGGFLRTSKEALFSDLRRLSAARSAPNHAGAQQQRSTEQSHRRRFGHRIDRGVVADRPSSRSERYRGDDRSAYGSAPAKLLPSRWRTLTPDPTAR